MQPLGPVSQNRTVFFEEGIEQQRRQSKVVNHLRLIFAVSKVADVLLVGYIGFRNNDDIRGNQIQYTPEEFNHVVGLTQMDTSGADFFPQVSDCIKSQDSSSLLSI